jgi:hypothetical protein
MPEPLLPPLLHPLLHPLHSGRDVGKEESPCTLGINNGVPRLVCRLGFHKAFTKGCGGNGLAHNSLLNGLLHVATVVLCSCLTWLLLLRAASQLPMMTSVFAWYSSMGGTGYLHCTHQHFITYPQKASACNLSQFKTVSHDPSSESREPNSPPPPGAWYNHCSEGT